MRGMENITYYSESRFRNILKAFVCCFANNHNGISVLIWLPINDVSNTQK